MPSISNTNSGYGGSLIESDNPVKKLDHGDPNLGQMLARPDPDIIDRTVTMREKLLKKKIQQSTPGIYVQAFDIEQSDWDNQTNWATMMQDYTNMRNGDAFVSTSIEVLYNPILNAELCFMPGFIEEEKPSDLAIEAKEYIEWTFAQMWKGSEYFIRHLVTAYFFGFTMFEKVWDKGVSYNGNITNQLIKLSPIQQDTLRRVYYDQLTEFMGVQVYKRLPNFGSRLLDLAAEQLHIFTPFEEYGSILGRSLLRPVRMVWDHKQKIWRASARAASRGAGIPVATLSENVKPTDTVLGNKISELVQTMGNSENAGLVEQAGVVTFRLMSLADQGHNLELLNLANSEIVYNTLSQFIISGIGQSGSRAATEAHKAPYLEALDVYFKQMENNINGLIKIIIDNSYLYGKLDESEYPYLVFERAKDVDLTALATNITNLVNTGGLKITPEDQKYIRATFGLPELSIEDLENPEDDMQETEANAEEDTTEEEENKPEIIDNNIETEDEGNYPDPDNGTLEKCHCEHTLTKNGKSQKMKPDTMSPIKKYLDTTYNRIEKTIEQAYQSMLDSVKHQLKKDRKAPVKIPESDKIALYRALEKHYNAGYSKGYEFSKRQIGKILPKKSMLESIQDIITLAKIKPSGPLLISQNGSKLEYTIDALIGAIETNVNKSLISVAENTIDNAGGIDDFIDNLFGQSQGKLKANLANNVSSSVIEGSSDAQADYEQESGNELLKTYTVQLERKNVCEICFPYEGAVFTKQEAENVGLKWEGTPLNPDCLGLLGGNDCQCTWVVEGIDEGGL